MKHFFLINKLLPDTCLGIKFGLNKIFDRIDDESTKNRILNAIYLLAVDSKCDELVDSGSIINNFTNVLDSIVEMEYSLGEDELVCDCDKFLGTNTILDAFFLVDYPQSIRLINAFKSNLPYLNQGNFFILKQLLSELYTHSRESCYDFLVENNSNENKLHDSNGGSLSKLQSDINEKEKSISCLSVDEFQTISDVLECNKRLKIGIPTFLDFDSDFNKLGRINFFYIDESSYSEMNSILKCVYFSLSLREVTLENLLQLLKKFQNIHKCNPVSILIFRLILNNNWDCIDNNSGILTQLINIGNSEDVIILLFECSLLMKDEELSSVFDLYYYLEIKTDFSDVLKSLRRIIQSKIDKKSSLWCKLSSWIRIDNSNLSYMEKFLLKKDFSNNCEMIKFFLDYFKSEINLTLKKYNSLLNVIETKNLDKDSANKIYELTKKLIYITPFSQRGAILDILEILFSLSEETEYNFSVSDLNDLYIMNYMSNGFFMKYLRTEKLVNDGELLCGFNDICENMLNYYGPYSNIRNIKEGYEELRNSTLNEAWIRFLVILFEKRTDPAFLEDLLKVFRIITVKQRLSLFWFITTHNTKEVVDRISGLCSIRRRISSLQCGINCIEIEMSTNLEQITQILKLNIDYESACMLLFISRFTKSNRGAERLLKIVDMVKENREPEVVRHLAGIVDGINFEFVRSKDTQELKSLGYKVKELLSGKSQVNMQTI
ncbi:hypothetical protein FG386_002463 [Cryptosporidium ryanae]|uniref:uncharacterized protein n=1 Tax=Cryptosporidium ryanae TaxID=515981 RepID=UPI00351AA9F2|nr:hypothetical protein FG386_002463 [Cryptosporidium ryanae]